MRLNSAVQTNIRNYMTVTKTYIGGNIKVTLEIPKEAELTEICPCDRCLVVCVEDSLLLHLKRPMSADALPA